MQRLKGQGRGQHERFTTTHTALHIVVRLLVFSLSSYSSAAAAVVLYKYSAIWIKDKSRPVVIAQKGTRYSRGVVESLAACYSSKKSKIKLTSTQTSAFFSSTRCKLLALVMQP